MSEVRDLLVIGGGAAGLVVASVSAQLGLDVVLINEQEDMGGDCLHFGCVPSKTLLKTASVANAIRRAERWGLKSTLPDIEMQQVNQHIQQVIQSLQHHDSRERFESLGCDVISGKARFTSSTEVTVNKQIIMARRIVVATGSTPLIPPIKGLQDVDYITNEAIFSLPAVPKHLVILGGGPIGVEMAQAYSRLGAEVSIIELAPRLILRADKDASAQLYDVLCEEGVKVYLDTEVKEVRQTSLAKQVTLSSGEVLEADTLLVAIGRRAQTQELDLEKAGIAYDARGIQVNKRMQTTNKRIFACGDVTGLMPLTHVAELQAGIVIANCAFRLPKKIDDKVVPAVIYTDPEVAQVGIGVEESMQMKHIEIHQFEVEGLDRAVTDNQTSGLAKVITKKGVIVGAHIVAPHAGELIHEYALAIQNRMKVSAITSLVHAYPSYSQLNKRLAGQYYQQRLFSPLTRKIVKWLNRLIP